MNQGTEKPIPKSFNSERDKLRIWLGDTKISSAAELRKLRCLCSQAPRQSPFESAARPFWGFTVDKAELWQESSQSTQMETREHFSGGPTSPENYTPFFFFIHLSNLVPPSSPLIYRLLRTPFIQNGISSSFFQSAFKIFFSYIACHVILTHNI